MTQNGDMIIEDLKWKRADLADRIVTILQRHRVSTEHISYISDVLAWIKAEEAAAPLRKKGRHIPYPWELGKPKVVASATTEMTLKKIEDNKENIIDISSVSPSLKKTIQELFRSISVFISNPLQVNGSIEVIYKIEIPTQEGNYLLEVYDAQPLQKSLGNQETKRKDTKTGELESDFSMYLLYRYFKYCLKLKKFYDLIAELCIAASEVAHRKGTGAEITGERVRKRVKWLELKKPHIVEYAKKYEKKRLQT